MYHKLALEYVVTLIVIVTFFVTPIQTKTTRRHFATKSRYPEYSAKDVSESPEACTAVHMNMVLRHGTRYPSTMDVTGINDMATFVNQYFDTAHPKRYNDLLLPWHNRFQNSGEKFLSDRGEQEMYNISQRLSVKFPSLFNTTYNGEQYHFVCTSTHRTSQSASAFAYGLFKKGGQLASIITTDLSNPILRFFDMCPKYSQEVANNKATSLREFNLFTNGPEMSHVKKAVASRLDIPHVELETKHVQHMFLSCAYELAIFGQGTWCSVFEEEDLDILDYWYDLKNFWKRGYGFEINYKMSCTLLLNLTESVNNAVNKPNETIAIFHFAHAETVIPLLCMLGLFNPSEPLRADNFQKQTNRVFRTSMMAPFSANVAVVLYSCDTGNDDSSVFHVQVLVNEKSVSLPCCGNKELCPHAEFQNCFGNIKEWCNLDEICKINTEGFKKTEL